MSKVQAMQLEQQRGLRPPPNTPRPKPPRPPGGPLVRWVRQGPRARVWSPWWLLGLVEVVSYPPPAMREGPKLYVPGVAASCGLPAREAFLVAL